MTYSKLRVNRWIFYRIWSLNSACAPPPTPPKKKKEEKVLKLCGKFLNFVVKRLKEPCLWSQESEKKSKFGFLQASFPLDKVYVCVCVLMKGGRGWSMHWNHLIHVFLLGCFECVVWAFVLLLPSSLQTWSGICHQWWIRLLTWCGFFLVTLMWPVQLMHFKHIKLTEPLWTDPGLKSGISVCKLISTLKKKCRWGMNCWTISLNPRQTYQATKRKELYNIGLYI